MLSTKDGVLFFLVPKYTDSAIIRARTAAIMTNNMNNMQQKRVFFFCWKVGK